MPEVKISSEVMALLVAEARERKATIKDIAEFCVISVLGVKEEPTDESEEESEEKEESEEED